jgi:DNA-binding transcriptional LysR family regulator
MAVTVTQLVAFLTVVRRGSVTAAAEELVVTQPSVSAAIAALERELGVAVMRRGGRTLGPTAAGEAYAGYAADVIGLLERGARAAREAAGAHRPTLRIGAVTTAAEHIVAPLLRTFRDAYPDLQVTLGVGNREQVFRMVVDHRVDVAITGRLPEDMPLEGRPFAPNDFTLVTAPDDPLARAQAVAVAELGGRRWLVREFGSGTRTVCEDYLASHGVSPEIVTIGSNGAIKQAVSLGLGVALQSLCAVALELELGRLARLRVRGGLPQRHWYVVRSAIGPVRPEVAAFMEYTESRAAAQALAPPA